MAALDAGYLVAEAIVTKWNATSALTAAMKGPFKDRKHVGTADGAYCVIDFDSTQEGWTCARQYWIVSFTFMVYDRTPEAAGANLKLVNDTFESETVSLTFSAGGMVNHRLVAVDSVEDEPGDIEHAEASYEFRIWRPRAA